MKLVRRLIAHRHLAGLLCAATLLLKLVVPTGYMIGTAHGLPVLTICSGMAMADGPAASGGRDAAAMMAAAMPGMHDAAADHGKPGDHGKAEAPCAFAGLSAAALGSIDPIQLAALLLFIVVVALVPRALPVPARRPKLRPPMRAPPACL